MSRTLRMSLALLVTVGAARTALAGPASADRPHVRVELVAERAAVVPGHDVVVGLRFSMEPHWHIYWKHEGDSGTAPVVRWTLPPGAVAGPIEWPAPRRFVVGSLAGFGYEGDVVLPVTLRAPAGPAPDPSARFAVTAALEWLVCDPGECVPGDATLRLDLPFASEEPAPDPRVGPLFAAARAASPKPLPAEASAAAFGAPGRVDLALRGAGPWTAPGAAFTWFPVTPLSFAHAEDVTVRAEGDALHLRLPLARGRTAPPRLDGVLVARVGGERRAWSIDLPVESEGEAAPAPASAAATAGPAAPSTAAAAPAASAPEDASGARATAAGAAPAAAARPAPARPAAPLEIDSVWLALLYAFAAGVVLNVMPCVLPVISLKILGFVQQAGEDPRRVRRHGYAFAAGVVVSFWALAGLLLGLRTAGEAAGWGFQFQEPGFTGALCLVMFAIGLNLLGVFEVGMGLASRAGEAEARLRTGYLGSFASGVLATIVATPCTAPFMGAALVYALAVPAVTALLVFTALAAGMAAPYVVLSAFPTWLERLPAPGRWMETFKQVMAFPMFAVVVYVGHVFGRQTGTDGLTWLFAALLAVGVAAWLWGRFGRVDAVGRARALAGRALPGVFGAAALAALVIACGNSPGEQGAPPQGWIAWRPGIEAELRATGRPVFVDFTADWCLTCLANDKAVLSTDTVKDAARLHGVAMVRADWTRKSAEVRDALAALGRASIPVYVVYPPDPSAPGEVLPTTITPGMIVDAMERASARP